MNEPGVLVEIGDDAENYVKDKFNYVKKRHHPDAVPRRATEAANFLRFSVAHFRYLLITLFNQWGFGVLGFWVLARC